MGAPDIIRAAGGKLWLISEVISGYRYARYLRTDESGGGFQPLARNNGQTGRLTRGAGTMVMVCLGRSFQPLICCRVRIQTSSMITGRCFVCNCSGVGQTSGPMPLGFHSQEYPRHRSKPLSRRDMRE